MHYIPRDDLSASLTSVAVLKDVLESGQMPRSLFRARSGIERAAASLHTLALRETRIGKQKWSSPLHAACTHHLTIWKCAIRTERRQRLSIRAWESFRASLARPSHDRIWAAFEVRQRCCTFRVSLTACQQHFHRASTGKNGTRDVYALISRSRHMWVGSCSRSAKL